MSGAGKISEWFEKLVGQAKKATEGYSSPSGLKPILALEARVTPAKLKVLIEWSAERLITPSIPQIEGKNVLEVGEAPLRYIGSFLEKKASVPCGVMVSPGAGIEGANILLGSFKNIPFENGFFDFAIVRLANPLQGDVVSAVKELGRVLSADASGILLDYHPFGLYARSGTQRLKSVENTIRGLEDYYKMCRIAGLQIADLKEIFFDDTMRSQFAAGGEQETFREIKGSPFLICLWVAKTRARG